MCDPITIIGLAASVVQIVDVTGRLISKSCEIYSSVDGAFRENVDLEFLIVDLQKTNAKLARIPLQIDENNILDCDDKALRQLCCGCNEVAEQLLSQLAVLKISDTDDPKKLASVKSAWKFMRSKKDLDLLSARVAAFREQLHMRLLVSITDRFQGLQLEQKCRFDNLDRSGKDIIDSIKHTRTLISSQIGDQTEYLTALAKSHHEEIINTLSIIVDTHSLSRSTSPNALEQEQYIKVAGVPSLPLHQLVTNGDYTGMHIVLRQRPDAIYDVNSDGETALHTAARKGDLKAVAYLMRKGANKNADNLLDQTPLHLATISNRIDVIRLLVAKGADTDTEDEHGRRPVELIEPTSEAAWVLKIGSGLDDRDSRGYTLLRELVHRGDLEGVESLLDRGADIEAKSENLEFSPLRDAGMKQDLAMMELLIKRGANLEALDNRQGTALINISWHGLAAPVKVLLDHGANINASNETGATALHEVAWHNHDEAAALILQYGPNLEARNSDGDTPLALAVDSGNINCVRMLLEKGAEVDTKCNDGQTALYTACAQENIEIVKELLKNGADVEAERDDGYNPLCITAIEGNIEIMKLLLMTDDVDVDSEGRDGRTPLMEATYYEHSEMVKLLLDAGARPL